MPSLPCSRARTHITSRTALRVTLLATLALTACSTGVAAPLVEDPWIRSNPNGMGAAYLTITMPTADTLVAAEVDASIAGRVEVHEVLEDGGMMRMREVDGGIPLPAGSAVDLRPGGYHIMLLDMPDMLDIGSTVDVTLRFATADPIVVVAEVREGTGAGGMPEHGAHGMDHGSQHGNQHGGDHGSHGTGHGNDHGPRHGSG
jgi:copper(I)-binding protein